jgi:NADP-dependent aldehyde dehydrogenase
MGVGQFCTKPGLVFAVGGPELDAVQAKLTALFAAAAPATMLHPGICAAFQQGFAHTSTVDGVKILARAATPADPSKTQGAPALLRTDAANFLKHSALAEEVFGPSTLLVVASSPAELEQLAHRLDGQLTATIHAAPEDLRQAAPLFKILERKAGRLLLGGFPTGVEVCPSMNHGGPYPATTDARFTSVGTAALARFVRPVSYQTFPPALLPAALQDENPLGLRRMVDGQPEVAGK